MKLLKFVWLYAIWGLFFPTRNPLWAVITRESPALKKASETSPGAQGLKSTVSSFSFYLRFWCAVITDPHFLKAVSPLSLPKDFCHILGDIKAHHGESFNFLDLGIIITICNNMIGQRHWSLKTDTSCKHTSVKQQGIQAQQSYPAQTASLFQRSSSLPNLKNTLIEL